MKLQISHLALFIGYLILVVFVIGIILAPSAKAQTGTIQITPAYIEISLKDPQEEKSFDIEFKNNSQKNVSLEISALDFRSVGDRGGISFLGKESSTYSYSLSSFLSFDSNRIDIDKGETRILEVTVKNRPDLSPGGHYAAVIARLVNETKEENANIISPALSSLIFMRKEGGERFNLSIQEMDFPNFPIAFGVPRKTELVFQNEGNIHLVPYGRYEIRDIFGRVIYKGVLNTSSAFVLPESRRLIASEIKRVSWVFPLSINEVEVLGTDSLRKTTYSFRDSYVHINPILLFIMLFLILLLFKKRIKRSIKVKK